MFESPKEKLYTPVIGDVLDKAGYYYRFLPAGIRPLETMATSSFIDPTIADKRMKNRRICLHDPDV